MLNKEKAIIYTLCFSDVTTLVNVSYFAPDTYEISQDTDTDVESSEGALGLMLGVNVERYQISRPIDFKTAQNLYAYLYALCRYAERQHHDPRGFTDMGEYSYRRTGGYRIVRAGSVYYLLMPNGKIVYVAVKGKIPCYDVLQDIEASIYDYQNCIVHTLLPEIKSNWKKLRALNRRAKVSGADVVISSNEEILLKDTVIRDNQYCLVTQDNRCAVYLLSYLICYPYYGRSLANNVSAYEDRLGELLMQRTKLLGVSRRDEVCLAISHMLQEFCDQGSVEDFTWFLETNRS